MTNFFFATTHFFTGYMANSMADSLDFFVVIVYYTHKTCSSTCSVYVLVKTERVDANS